MKIAEFKNALESTQELTFVLPNGNIVPSHFHVTEIGLISKNFIDCGGVVREEKKINFQLWVADDVNHKLQAQKLLGIISLFENKFTKDDLEIEVEYQGETIQKFGLAFSDSNFKLTATQTDCLAKDNCGVTETKQKIKLAEIGESQSCCEPGKCC